MSGIHQTLVAAAPGDAITNSAFEIRRLLREAGPSEIYARHIHGDLCGDVKPLHEHPAHGRSQPGQLTIVHPSNGDAEWLEWVLGLDGRFILSYHNFTPSHFFRVWDRPTADRLEFGRRTLGMFADRTVLAFADSAFNAIDLRDAGYANVVVGGLLIDTSGLSRTSPDVGVLTEAMRFPGPTIVHIGQLYPHKRADFAIVAFHRLLRTGHPDARLVLAGASRLPAFRKSLEQLVVDLELTDRVVITGRITPAAMSAYLRSADVMVTASEHEGFCVPLIEAMTLGVPVVGRRFGAVPETAGDAAILLEPDAPPSAMAAALAAVLDDRAAADELRELGYRRAADFTLDRLREQFLDALVDAC